MNGPGKVFREKCFQGFGDFFDMNGSGSWTLERRCLVTFWASWEGWNAECHSATRETS